MPKVIEVPNLGTVEFPDDTPEEAINSSITDHLDRLSKKSQMGEEMKSLRRQRVLGDIGEGLVSGAEAGTKLIAGMYPTEAIGNAATALGIQAPIPPEHVRQAREFLSAIPPRAELPANVPTVGPALDPNIEKGVNQFVDEMISGLTRPDQAALLAAGGRFPTEVARTFQLAPVVEAPQQIQQLQQTSEAGDVAGTVKGIAGLTAGALLPSVIEAGLNKGQANAKTIRSNQGQPLEAGTASAGGEANRSGDLQQTAPGTPDATRAPLAPEGTPRPAQPEIPLNEEAPVAAAEPAASVPSTETAGVPEAGSVESGKAKAPLKAGEVPTPADIHAATHEEFMAYHDAMKAPGEQRLAVNEFAKSLDEEGIKEAERLAQQSREKAKSIINGDGPLERRFKQSMEENQRTQFLDEGARTAKAMKAVADGGDVAEAAKKYGVPVSALEAPKVVEAPKPVESEPPKRETYGERYIKDQGVKGAQDRVRHLNKRIDEETYKGHFRTVENLIDEVDRISKALRDQGHEVPSILEADQPAKPVEAPAPKPNKVATKPMQWEPLYKAEHADLLDIQKRIEHAREFEPDAVKALEQEKGDIIQRLGEFDKLSKADTRVTWDTPKETAQIMALRENPEMTAAEAYAEGQRMRKQDIADRIHDQEPVPAKAFEEFPDLKPKEETASLPEPAAAPEPKRLAVISNSHRQSKRLARVEGELRGGIPLSLHSKTRIYEILDTPKNRELLQSENLKIHQRETDKLNARYARIKRMVEESAPKPEPAPVTSPVAAEPPKPSKAKSKKAPPVEQAALPLETTETPAPKPEPATAAKADSWTSATEDESGRLYLNPIGPLIKTTISDIRDFSHAVKKSAEWIIEKGREAAGKGKEAYREGFDVGGKMNDYRRSVLNWSMKLQKSFGEAARAQKDIKKQVPDSIRREGITNWIQAGGDKSILANRAATTTDARLKKGYEAALNLTPDELALAQKIKGVYDALGIRGQSYGVLNNFKENYVTQIWDLKNRLGGSARTLKDKFKYAKARTFDSFYDGEQAGYTPKTKDIAKLLPSYLHEMNSVIAARQLVKQMQKGVASDGRELLVPRGKGTPVSGPSGDATLITPKAVKGDTSDYKLLPNQPALNDWVWAAKDQAGNNIFLKSDLMVHPAVYDKLKNTLGRSAIQEWYKSDTGAIAAIPKRAVELIDRANAGTKRTMLGLITPFHQVQEGTHAVGHRVNPFSVPDIDLVGKPEQADAAKHGLMLLPDRTSEAQFMDGFKTTGLLSHVPILGRITDAYSNYLFHKYIPGLKFKTYEAILDRNKQVFAKDMASGKVSLEDVKVTSAEQANAAYGHLNYTDLGRNPTVSHAARALLLAPDFLEARVRFAGQAAKGAAGFKIGREQVLALGFLALTQAATAYTMAKLTGGEWDAKHPFEMTRQGKRYTMRSVPEDISSLIKDPRQFINNRLSPAASTIDELHRGLDWKNDRISAVDTLKEAAQKPIPLSVRAAAGMNSKNITPLEQLAGSVGLKISSANPKAEKAIALNDRTELLANKLKKLDRAQRYRTAKEEMKDMTPQDRNKVIQKLRRQGVFTYK